MVAFLTGAQRKVVGMERPLTPSWPPLLLPAMASDWPLVHKAPLHSPLWLLCTCWPAPTKGPFLAFFSILKRPQGGPRAQWLSSQVALQRRCCSVERHVESQGEREEDIINHELLKARRVKGELAGAGRTELKWRLFFSCSCCCVVEESVLGHLPRHMLS